MSDIQRFLDSIKLPEPNSHKGQNGKLLIIGGSQLFHAASKWSLDVASKFVDMVFYSSVPSNNELVQAAKGEFWNGIVVNREDMEPYIDEADCILIGPGMERTDETKELINALLQKYPQKKWVIDAGALQMVDPKLLTASCIVTPHQKEWEDLKNRMTAEGINTSALPCTIVIKGPADHVLARGEDILVEGGNAGMTKGGTGDVLAGLTAAVYCTHDAATAAVVASYMNKKAGDALYEKVGPYFNASDLVAQIPETFWQIIKKK